MPFYEYECSNCGFRDEVLQKINDKPLKKCPSCGKSALKKLISAPVFRLKGSGWYETDFKSDKENKRNLAGAEKPEAKPEAKTDTKPDAAKVEKAADKSEAKPAPEKASRGASKTATTRAKPKATPKRPGKRATR